MPVRGQKGHSPWCCHRSLPRQPGPYTFFQQMEAQVQGPTQPEAQEMGYCNEGTQRVSQEETEEIVMLSLDATYVHVRYAIFRPPTGQVYSKNNKPTN